jgi:protocatechuate 3,4-dioxygenase beta subunit
VTAARARLVVFAAGLVLTGATTATAQASTSRCDGFPQTPGEIGGVHFRASPLRHDVVFPTLSGTRLTLEGVVLTTACKPVRHARLDFWQAEAQGHYDDTGFRLRSHQFTDVQGRYRLETIVPGPYPGRTPHVHVKVHAPGQPTLTTELYFPGASYNSRDPYFDRRLLLRLAEVKKTLVARFDFVLRVR